MAEGLSTTDFAYWVSLVGVDASDDEAVLDRIFLVISIFAIARERVQ